MKRGRESSEKSDDVSSSKQTNVDFEIAFLNACRKRKLDVVRRLLFEKRVDVNEAKNDRGDTGLHIAAQYRHVDVVKVLIQNGADVNAVQEDKWTALHIAARNGHVPCTLQLLCCGAKIEEKTIKEDKTKLLLTIESGLKLLRRGDRVRTSLMSEEERRFMWNLGFVLTKKHPAIAFRTYHRIRSFVTFHGIFIGPGYDQGKESIWTHI